MKQSIIDIVEAAYALEGSEESWLERIVEATKPLIPSELGVAGWTYQLDESHSPVIDSIVTLGGGPAAKERIVVASSMVAPRDHSMSYFAPQVCVSLADKFGSVANLKKSPFWKSEWAAQDLLMIKSLDIVGRGCMLFAPTVKRVDISSAMESRWRHAFTHVCAGMRLRRSLSGFSADTADAVFEADGRPVQASGEAKEHTARDDLREAIKRIDHSRGKMRSTDPDAALEAWQGLVDGRWSLVDHFDSDGRHYILARRNDPHVVDPRALTPQERQITRYAACGLSNNHIAYTLGVSEARVSQALSAAVRKLGVGGRADLVKRFAGGGRPPEADKGGQIKPASPRKKTGGVEAEPSGTAR